MFGGKSTLIEPGLDGITLKLILTLTRHIFDFYKLFLYDTSSSKAPFHRKTYLSYQTRRNSFIFIKSDFDIYCTQFLTFLYDAFSSKENVVSGRNVHIYADLGKINKTDLEHGSLKSSNLIDHAVQNHALKPNTGLKRVQH